MKKKLAATLSVVLILGLAVLGILAYLSDTDSDVNVMTLGEVKIEQIEQERVDTSKLPTASDNLQDFTGNNGEEGKPLFPAVFDGSSIEWNPDSVQDQAWKVVATNANVVDKFVTVKNTGKSPAYVRTIIAYEGNQEYGPEGKWIHVVHNGSNVNPAINISAPLYINIDGVDYTVYAYTYPAALASGETSVPSLKQVYMDKDATNDEVAKYGDTYNILVVSQAVQTNGFADAATALDAGFGELNEENAKIWFNLGTKLVTPENIDSIDFNEPGMTFSLAGNFGDIAIPELGDNSVLDFNGANVGTLSLGDDATISGEATIDKIKAARNSTEPITLTINDADLDVTNEVEVKNTDGESVLNIENTKLYASTIYVGEHVNNHRAAKAEFNVNNSYISCEENGMGSTINVWGRSGVKSEITDSEIYTYSRGWHQSEDANDNAITFQGATSIDVDIQRSNMHLYGARSIVYARQYGSEDTTIDFDIDESLIWVVTKSNHGENTLPVWGADEITNSMLLFTKNVHQSTPAVFKSFVYGNPVVHGNYAVTTQCQWDAPIELNDQTVTFKDGANVSIYDGAGNVEFVKNGNSKVVVGAGATVSNIGGIN